MPSRHRPAAIAVLAALVAVALTAGHAGADALVVSLPPDHAFTVPQAMMIDQLLSLLAVQESSAYLVTPHSACAHQVGASAPGAASAGFDLAALLDPQGHVRPDALGRLAQDQGAAVALALVWKPDGLSAFVWGTGGKTSDVPASSPAKISDVKQDSRALADAVAVALATARIPSTPTTAPSAGGPQAPVSTPPATPGTPTTSASSAPGAAQATTAASPSSQRPLASTSAQTPGAAQRPPASSQPGAIAGSQSTGPAANQEHAASKNAASGPAAEGEKTPAQATAQPSANQPAAGTTAPAQPAATKPATKQGRLLYERAVQSFRQGDYQGALDRLETALRAGASVADVLSLQAKCYAALGDTNRQTRAMQELTSLEPGSADLAISLGLLLVDQGLWQEATRVLERAIAAAPDQPQLYVRLAAVYRRQGRTKEALKVLSRGVEATHDPQLAMALGAAYEGVNDLQAAQAVYAQLATSGKPAMAARALDALGDLYVQAKELDRGVEAYVEAASARGETATLSAARYDSVYGAVDALVAARVNRAWQLYTEVLAHTPGVPRESAFGALKTADAELARGLTLCDEALAPPSLSAVHKQRQLYYALLREAVTAALTCIDTGREDMSVLAAKRLKQALEQRPAAAATASAGG